MRYSLTVFGGLISEGAGLATIDHINQYGTGHSEAIVSENYHAVRTFMAGVDAAAVYANASTRFTDGNVFGFGAEMGQHPKTACPGTDGLKGTYHHQICYLW